MRHLAINEMGRLYIGGQVYDERRALGRKLVWVSENSNVTALELGDQMQGYISSVAASETQAMMSSKKNRQVIWLDGANYVKSARLENASALAKGRGREVISGGRVLRVNANDIVAAAGFEFDNHGLVV